MSPRPLPPESDIFEAALGLARAGRMEDALAGVSEVLSAEGARELRKPAAALAYAEVARLAEAVGDLGIAERALDEALRLAGDYPDLHFRRGCLLLRRQQGPAARAALHEALRINPRYVAARVELALLDAREGLLGESLATLRDLEQGHRVDQPRTFHQGLKSLERADWEEAGALLKSALHLSDPAVDEALSQHRELVARGEHARALHALREAVTAHPGYPDLHYVLGCCELEAGLTDDALASLARALELHPGFHAARIQFARTFEALGDPVQAGEQVALVLQEEPDHPQALELHARWASRGERPRRGTAGARKAS